MRCEVSKIRSARASTTWFPAKRFVNGGTLSLSLPDLDGPSLFVSSEKHPAEQDIDLSGRTSILPLLNTAKARSTLLSKLVDYPAILEVPKKVYIKKVYINNAPYAASVAMTTGKLLNRAASIIKSQPFPIEIFPQQEPIPLKTSAHNDIEAAEPNRATLVT